MKFVCWMLALLLLPGALLAQVTAGCTQGSAVGADGKPLKNAIVRVCSDTATGNSCTPLSTLYTDPTGTVVNPFNPFTTADGNYSFCAAVGDYQVQVQSFGVSKTFSHVRVAGIGSGSGGGSTVSVNGANVTGPNFVSNGNFQFSLSGANVSITPVNPTAYTIQGTSGSLGRFNLFNTTTNNKPSISEFEIGGNSGISVIGQTSGVDDPVVNIFTNGSGQGVLQFPGLGLNQISGATDLSLLAGASKQLFLGDVTNGTPFSLQASTKALAHTGKFTLGGSEAASTVVFTVKHASANSGDLQQWQDSSGSVVAKMDTNGNLTTGGSQFQVTGSAGAAMAAAATGKFNIYLKTTSGLCQKDSAGTETCIGGSGGAVAAYATVQDDGTAQTQRAILNLKSGAGVNVACVDNSGATKTDCTFTSPSTTRLYVLSSGSTVWSGMPSSATQILSSSNGTQQMDVSGYSQFRLSVGLGTGANCGTCGSAVLGVQYSTDGGTTWVNLENGGTTTHFVNISSAGAPKTSSYVNVAAAAISAGDVQLRVFGQGGDGTANSAPNFRFVLVEFKR